MARAVRASVPAKRRFSIPVAFRRIRNEVRWFPKAALFQLAEEGFDSPFEQLVACINLGPNLDVDLCDDP